MTDVEVTTATGPSCWTCYFIYGDASGLEDDEQALADEWLRRQEPWYPIDVVHNEDGEPDEPRFTWNYDLHGGGARGGDVIDYVMHKS